MKTLIFLSKAYEEVEALTVVDYLRRAGIHIDMVATEGSLDTIGDHGIQIKADKLLEDIAGEDYAMMILPGGMGGTEALAANPRVLALLRDQFVRPKGYIASICASPLVLNRAGIAQQIHGTCYPGLEGEVGFLAYEREALVVHDKDHRVITSPGPATALYFALEIIEVLKGRQTRDQVAAGLLLPRLEGNLAKA